MLLHTTSSGAAGGSGTALEASERIAAQSFGPLGLSYARIEYFTVPHAYAMAVMMMRPRTRRRRRRRRRRSRTGEDSDDDDDHARGDDDVVIVLPWMD